MYSDPTTTLCPEDGNPLIEITTIVETKATGIETIAVVNEEVQMVATQATVRVQVITNRPFVIGLVNFGEVIGVSLERLASDLNRAQNGKTKLFQFQAIRGVTDLGEYDLPHNYSNKKLFSFITQSLHRTGINYGIGITVEELELGRFNSHDESAGLGLVTVYNHDEYKPSEKTLYQYLAYLILCEAFCITGHHHFEHDDKHYCLFDECSNKKDLKVCLEHPKIHCVQNLATLGFGPLDLANAAAILEYVRKRSVQNALVKTFSNPVVGMFLGGGIVNLLSGAIAALGSSWSWAITSFLFLGIVLFFLWSYFQPKKQ